MSTDSAPSSEFCREFSGGVRFAPSPTGRFHVGNLRSVDLFPAASIQRAIQGWLNGRDLNYEPPAIFHTALVTQDDGHRLEKRTRGVTLPELEKRGITAEKLLEIFARSFHSPLPFTCGSLMREQPEQLKLADLGLSS